MSGGRFRLDGRIGWGAASYPGVTLGREAATLAIVPGTAIPLAAADGSFGGQALPMRIAAGPDGILFLLDADGTILTYDPCREAFAPIKCVQATPRRPGLTRPIALAMHPAGDLLVLDGDTRSVTAIRLADLYPRLRWGPFIADGTGLTPAAAVIGIDPLTGAPDGTASAPAGAWTPADIACLADGRILISDTAANCLRLFDRRGCPLASWSGASDDQPALAAPGAIAVGHDGRIFVVEQGHAAIAILDSAAIIVERTEDLALVGEDLANATITVDAAGTLWISGRIGAAATIVRRTAAGLCGPAENVPLLPTGCTLLAFDSAGHAILGSPRAPCPLRADMSAYVVEGSVTTTAIDSGMIETIWDRATVELDLPEGTTVVIAAFASDAPLDDSEIAALGDSAWAATPLTWVEQQRAVVALRSAPGRYLWLKLTLTGDGKATPHVRAIVITSPRATSARFLPATFSAESASADFLARFMLLFDELRAEMLAPIDALPALYDPMATPAAEAGATGDDFLDWLGGWIGLALDRSWSVTRRRRLVREAPALFRMRGTIAGLKRHVAIYTGIEPRIVEHFRLRRWIALDEMTLDGAGKLWGPEIVRRLQLDEYSQIGNFALVDGGNPLTDPFGAFAHRATLYVPVGANFSDRDRAALEDVVEAAAPAHVVVDLKLAEPRFVIGCDSMLGVNTVLGCDRGGNIARADHAVLGEDVRLAGPPIAFTLVPGMRLGTDTTLQ